MKVKAIAGTVATQAAIGTIAVITCCVLLVGEGLSWVIVKTFHLK
jgi:hypothetical protein